MNLLAEKVGVSPWEIRWRNAIRPGDILPSGQIADLHTGMAECLSALKEAYESDPKAGIACAYKNSGIGVGNIDAGRCILSVEDGIVHIRTAAACMGQGVATVCVQMVSEETGLPTNKIIHERPDTIRTPDSGTSTASRQTVITGEAVKIAAEKLKADLDAGNSLDDLNGQEYHAEFLAETEPMGSKSPNPISHIAYSYGAAVAHLDDEGRVAKLDVAYDVGTPVNIQAIEGQIEGGAIMGLGTAISEDYQIKDGFPLKRYGTYGLLRATDIPEINIRLVRSSAGDSPYAFGAKGIGELSLIPIPPACSAAYYYRDGKLRTSLPMDDTFYRKPAKKESP